MMEGLLHDSGTTLFLTHWSNKYAIHLAEPDVGRFPREAAIRIGDMREQV